MQYNRISVHILTVLGQRLAGPIQHQGQDVYPHVGGQLEGPLVEPSYLAILGACTLGEDGYGVASVCQVLDSGFQLVVPHRDRVVFGMTQDIAKEGAVIDPVVGQEYHLAGQPQQHHQVQVALMVADDDGRLTEGLGSGVDDAHLAAGHVQQLGNHLACKVQQRTQWRTA